MDLIDADRRKRDHNGESVADAADQLAALRRAYIELVKSALTGVLVPAQVPSTQIEWIDVLRKYAPSIFGRWRGTERDQAEGRVWPQRAYTMIGNARLDNLHACVQCVIDENIEGDLIETGVWRGGACILMNAILRANAAMDRSVWVADSFQGLPPPDAARAPADKGDRHHTYDELAVPLERVKANFRAFGLLDDNVKFLQGWFSQTLACAPIEKLAVCRLDGDMYASTMDALDALYRRLTPGGFLIVDDYGAVEGCRKAVDEFRTRHAIGEPMQAIDWSGVYWRRDH